MFIKILIDLIITYENIQTIIKYYKFNTNNRAEYKLVINYIGTTNIKTLFLTGLCGRRNPKTTFLIG